MRRASFFFLALLFVAGCGGGGGGQSAGQQRLTKADYAAKADSICRKYNEQTNAVGNPKNLADLAKAFDSALPALDKAIADLQKLQPPKGEQALVDRWLAQSRILRNDLRDIRDRAKAKDLKGVQAAFTKAQGENNASDDVARKLGLTACAKG